MSWDSAVVCGHVADERAPIRYASREEVGDGELEWRFECGAGAHGADEARLWTLDEVVRYDPTTVDIVLRPRGTALARASASESWRVRAGPLPLPRHASRHYPELRPRYAPRPGEPLDAGDLRLVADVAQSGWHVVVAPEHRGTPGFAHTVGLFRSFDHPEVMCFGLPPDALGACVDRVGDLVRAGVRFADGTASGGIFQGHDVVFRNVSRNWYPEYLERALWYHGGSEFPVLQCLWPDTRGRFPWDRWCTEAVRRKQPLPFQPGAA